MDWFVQLIPRVFNRIEIEIRLNSVMFLEPFLNTICTVTGHIVLLKEVPAMRNAVVMKWCYNVTVLVRVTFT